MHTLAVEEPGSQLLSPPLQLVVLLVTCGEEEEGAKIRDDFGPTKASTAIEGDVVVAEVVQQHECMTHQLRLLLLDPLALQGTMWRNDGFQEGWWGRC